MVVSFSQLIEQILSQEPEMDNQLDQLADNIVDKATEVTAVVKKTLTDGLLTILSGYRTERVLRTIEEGSIRAQSRICQTIITLKDEERSHQQTEKFAKDSFEQVHMEFGMVVLCTDGESKLPSLRAVLERVKGPHTAFVEDKFYVLFRLGESHSDKF